MKKTLLIAAAALAAGIISTQASSVYSQNIVGYANQTAAANKFLLANNPLDLSTVPGGNIITNVLPGTYVDGTTVYVFDPVNGYTSESYFNGYGWYPGTTVLNPGVGFFITSTADITNTYTGNVLIGSQTNALANGFTLVGSPVPQALPLGAAGITDSTNTLVFPASDNDNVYTWDYVNQTYVSQTYFAGYGWYDSTSTYDTNGYVPPVGVGFYVQKSSAVNWIRNYTPQ